jgi:hypothetical protein
MNILGNQLEELIEYGHSEIAAAIPFVLEGLNFSNV